jgi:putative membrane protein
MGVIGSITEKKELRRMNGYYDGNMGWGGWLLMTLVMITFGALIVYLLITLVRGSSGSTSSTSQSNEPNDPQRILEERLARGDIPIDEYQARKDALGHTKRT